MKLGLITDIHEQVDPLQWALDLFGRQQVEQIVVLGDVFEMGRQIEETCRLLAAAQAVGVWGNHDFGLCFQPGDAIRARYSSAVVGYMTSLRPRLKVADCHFSHIEPWLDPEVITDLWYFDWPLDDRRKLDRIFNAVKSRIMFAGHYHQWLLATPAGVDEWNGDVPIQLDQGRYFVVIGALCEGHCATFDTVSSELIPYSNR
jgi:hypothetical protein